jgi:excinuclease ABC subunit C
MGQCLGVCVGEITAAEYKKKVITPLSMFLQGRKKVLLVKIQKQMKEASRAHKYEEASRLRDQLKALQHIQDIALLNKEFVEDTVGFLEKIRIEGYDIAHISGTSMVGSMVVLNANGPQNAHYRKFKIKTVEGANDTAALQEVLERRLGHPEWPYPDVFLIDGGTAQVNAVYKVLQKNTINIPIVGIAKGPSRKNNKFSHKPNTKSFGNWVAKHKNLLIQARDEAHRFAQSYHKKLRGKKLLS